MREHPRVVRGLVAKSFDRTELDYLHQQPEFQRAFAKMDSLDDFENLVMLAVCLFDERDALNRGALWPHRNRLRAPQIAYQSLP